MCERLAEPSGIIQFTAAIATSLFAMRYIAPGFIHRYPKINVIHYMNDDQAAIVGGSYDLRMRTHSGPLSGTARVQPVLALVL